MKTAIITGIAGQDGPYLAKILLEQGYNVVGWARRNASLYNLDYLGIRDRVKVVDVDICDPFQVSDEIYKAKPQEIYNLAAQSHVGQSFKNPMVTCQVNYGGYLNILLSARKFFPDCKIYQAGTSEQFGYAAERVCDEGTPFAPMSPYAISKVASYWAGVNSRFEANQFVCNGILFNHESPLRGKDFVTKKVTDFVKGGANGVLRMGNLDTRRDWGFAGDYMRAAWMMMQQPSPNDFVIATGTTITLRTMIKIAFDVVGKKVEFVGKGSKEVGVVDGKVKIVVDEEFLRPNDLTYLAGSARKAKQLLNWQPTTSVEKLIHDMVKS